MTRSKNCSGSASTSGSGRRSAATRVGGVGDGLPPGGLEVGGHVRVVGEERRGGADLGAHVADGALAGGRDGVGAGAEVLDDGAGAALHGEDLGDLEDDVLRARPAGELAGEVDADELGPADVEREAGHHVDGVGAADPDGHHAEAAGVGGVAVGADHHPAGEGVVLEHDLVDDARARLPEADAVAGRHRPEELVDLAVDVEGELEVEVGAGLGQDQVVAVDGARHRRLVEAGGHELQQRHLGGGVLHGDPVRVEVGVADAAVEPGVAGRAQVVEQDLLGEGERPAEALAAEGDPFGEPAVHAVDELDRGGRGDGHGGDSPACVLPLSRQDYTSDGTRSTSRSPPICGTGSPPVSSPPAATFRARPSSAEPTARAG